MEPHRLRAIKQKRKRNKWGHFDELSVTGARRFSCLCRSLSLRYSSPKPNFAWTINAKFFVTLSANNFIEMPFNYSKLFVKLEMIFLHKFEWFYTNNVKMNFLNNATLWSLLTVIKIALLLLCLALCLVRNEPISTPN